MPDERAVSAANGRDNLQRSAARRAWKRVVADPFPFAVVLLALCVAAVVVATYA